MSGYLDIFIDQGASYNTAIALTDVSNSPINLSNHLVVGQIKSSYYSANVIATFDISFANVQGGEVFISLPYTTTANIKSKRYVYDVLDKDLSSNSVTRVLEGTVYITPGVTQFS